MGLFSWSKKTAESKSSSTNNTTEKSEIDIALEYFSDERIKCASNADEDTIIYMHKQLEEANRNTSCEDNMIDAIGSLDRHVYRLCLSIM